MFDKIVDNFTLDKATTKAQLSYQQMHCLALQFEHWVESEQVEVEQLDKLSQWARALRELAEELGEHWTPPKPDKLSIIGFMGRKVEAVYQSQGSLE